MKTFLGALGLCCFLALPTQAQQADQDAEDAFGADAGISGTPSQGQRRFRGGAQGQDDSDAAPRGRSPGAEDGGQRGLGPGGRGGRGRGPSNPMFEAIDADGDGVISERELRRAGAALKTLDADNDGAITLAEVRPAGGFEPGGPGGPGGGAAGIFGRLDQNGDGKLSADEIPPQMMERFSGGDANGDGAIDQEEMSAMMESGQFGRGGRGGAAGAGGQGFGRGAQGFGPGGNDPQVFMQQFTQSDRNRDGVLTANELSREQLAMLQGADADGNAAISQQEFMQAVQKMTQRGGRFGGPNGQAPGGQRFGRQGAQPTDRFNGNDGGANGAAPQDRGAGRNRRGRDAAEE